MRIAIRSFAAILVFPVLVGSAFGADKKKPKPLSATEVFRRSVSAIVAIDCLGANNAKIGTASGFLVADNGKILTNLHVIQQCQSLTVRLSNGDAYDSANVIDVDVRKDIALIRIKAVSLPVLALGDSNAIQVGEAVYSIGNPSGLQNTLQQGLVSGFRERTGYRVVQVSASINPGNSGGPVLDDQGNVIAIAAMKVVNAENLGFAIPINYAKGYLDTKTEIPFATFAAAIKQAAANNAKASSVPPNATIKDQEPPSGSYRVGNDVSAPIITAKSDPEYTEEALQAKLSGTVAISLVVDEAGMPKNLKVLRSLEPGLDRKALEAVQHWRFKPGMKDGKPVPVFANIEVNFRLPDNPSNPVVSGFPNNGKPVIAAGQRVEALKTASGTPQPTSSSSQSASSSPVSDARGAEAKEREGLQLLNQGKRNEAIAALTEAIRLDPTFAEAYLDRCKAYTGDPQLYTHGVEDCDKAIVLRPSNAAAYVARAKLSQYRAPDEALRDYTEALRLNPTLEDAYESRGRFFMNAPRKDTALAIQDFTSAIKLKPDLYLPYFDRAIELAELKDYDSAIKDYDQAIRILPETFTFKSVPYNRRGDAHQAQGKYQEAVQDYIDAIRLDHNNVLPYVGRAKAKAAMGQEAGLGAPKLVSPNDGAVFDQLPRKTVLVWSEVKGAVAYIVEYDYKFQNNWAHDAKGDFRALRTEQPTVTFEFTGAQPGRWRVWALDASGAAGAKSEWREFR